MGWVVRGGKQYFYHSFRLHGRVRTSYLGPSYDPGARDAALVVAQEARDRRRKRAMALRRGRAIDRAGAMLRGWSGLVEAITAAALEREGYRRCGRHSVWRKRRMGATTPATTSGPPAVPAPSDEELKPLLELAKEGDRAATTRLCDLLRDDPERLIALARGDIADLAQRVAILKCAGPRNPLFRAAAQLKIDRMEADLAGPAPTPLESRLVHRVVMNWFSLHQIEMALASSRDRTLGQLEPYDRRRERASRMSLSAIEKLGQLRRLHLPAPQINVAMDGGRQFNVATPFAGPGGPEDA